MAEFEYDDVGMAMGARPGVRNIDVVFTATDVDTGDVPETVSPIGGLVPLRSAAAVLELISSSAQDAAAGTGAIEVRVWGLDADWNELVEIVPLNGTTAVQTTGQFLRVNDVVVQTAGTSKSNVGTITIRDAGAGTTRSMMTPGRGRAEVGVFSVPAGHSVLAVGWMIASRDASGNSSADVEFYCTCNGVRKVDWSSIVSGMIPVHLGTAHIFEEKSDVEVIVSRVMNSNTIVSVHGHGLLVKNGGAGL